MKKNEAIRNAKNFDEVLDIQYGKIGTDLRDEFEENAQYFIISELLKDARREANMTQEELANKIGTKKSYISRLENGKCDIQLSTPYRIFEFGLGPLDEINLHLLVDLIGNIETKVLMSMIKGILCDKKRVDIIKFIQSSL